MTQLLTYSTPKRNEGHVVVDLAWRAAAEARQLLLHVLRRVGFGAEIQFGFGWEFLDGDDAHGVFGFEAFAEGQLDLVADGEVFERRAVGDGEGHRHGVHTDGAVDGEVVGYGFVLDDEFLGCEFAWK